MLTDQAAQQLHDKATRGEVLSAADRALLDEWYAHQDAGEHAALSRESASARIVELRNHVDAAVSKLHAVAQRIQTLSRENEALRREISVLHRQLAQKTAAQSA